MSSTRGTTSTFRRALFRCVPILALAVLAGCGPMVERTDFTTAVSNKSDDEVQKLYGKPASVESPDADHVVWTYKGMTFNLADGNKRDSKEIVTFTRSASTSKLMVTDVKFE